MDTVFWRKGEGRPRKIEGKSVFIPDDLHNVRALVVVGVGYVGAQGRHFEVLFPGSPDEGVDHVRSYLGLVALQVDDTGPRHAL